MRQVSLDGLATALAKLPPQPRVVVSGNAATPWAAVAALDSAVPEYRIWALNAGHGIPDRPGVVAETSFVGVGMRHHSALSYVPSRLSMVPVLFAGPMPPDVVIVHCAPERDGRLSLGTEVNVLPAAIEACHARGGLVVAVRNDAMPYTFGDSQLDAELIDLVVDIDVPLAEHQAVPPDDASLAVAERVSDRIGDGATLQMGIGAIPDAAVGGLTSRRGLGIWSEMFSDGLLTLDRAGALDRERRITASFCFGSRELYDVVDGNPGITMARTEVVNSPGLIAQNPAMTSINTALEVDLYGQANASRINGRIHSGYGGQTDFIVGALHSPGGQAMLALRSWHPRADVSSIVPLLDEPVTSFQPSAVITEQGVADLFGRDQESQARDLIEQTAHPRVRAELHEEARALGLA
ncbi:acetyl-CoA hydrolase/transferase family protein [Knoellia subterranea]|uniref:4-hydroxybutyrate CoA-transferase n=1 Tax=Knoellia subterranea KCTC 19937 TaxID=1385521 RepID=A0A0A0JP24_9MICO|nr:acetyl-CoA hydrolase/transferase C-terminal domain-containing protein [Knoellia subterranea]KGN37807.1 4-hydroxybutyrate CoA-transferase [Knoellia subterranea KCTC 19937]